MLAVEGRSWFMDIRIVRMNDVDFLDKENSILTQQHLSWMRRNSSFVHNGYTLEMTQVLLNTNG